MTIEERITKLENFVLAYISQQNYKAYYDDCDKAGLRHTDGENARAVEEVKGNVIASEEALCDVDEAYDQRVADVEEALCELSELQQ